MAAQQGRVPRRQRCVPGLALLAPAVSCQRHRPPRCPAGCRASLAAHQILFENVTI